MGREIYRLLRILVTLRTATDRSGAPAPHVAVTNHSTLLSTTIFAPERNPTVLNDVRCQLAMERVSNEVLEHLLSYLDCVDIDSCRLACRRLRAVIHGSILLRYLYRLQRSGRIDPNIHSSKLSISRRLHALQDHENAWLRADFTPVSTVRLPMNDIDIAEIASTHESIYLLSHLDRDHQSAFGKLMRLHDASVTDCGGSWQELDLTGQPASTDMRVVRDVNFLEECNLIMVSSV